MAPTTIQFACHPGGEPFSRNERMVSVTKLKTGSPHDGVELSCRHAPSLTQASCDFQPRFSGQLQRLVGRQLDGHRHLLENAPRIFLPIDTCLHFPIHCLSENTVAFQGSPLRLSSRYLSNATRSDSNASLLLSISLG